MIRGVKVEIAGDTYEVPPLNLGALERYQDALASLGGDLSAASTKTMLDVIHAAMARNYPHITREIVGEMVDVANMGEIMQAVMDISGLRRKAQEAIETPGEPSIGADFTPTS